MTATVPMHPSTVVVYQVSKDLLDELILKALEKGFERGQKKPIEKPLTKQEAADYMSISLSSLDERLRNGYLPLSLKHTIHGTPYFFASELENFIRKS